MVTTINSLNVYTKAQKPIDSYIFGDVLRDTTPAL